MVISFIFSHSQMVMLKYKNTEMSQQVDFHEILYFIPFVILYFGL